MDFTAYFMRLQTHRTTNQIRTYILEPNMICNSGTTYGGYKAMARFSKSRLWKRYVCHVNVIVGAVYEYTVRVLKKMPVMKVEPRFHFCKQACDTNSSSKGKVIPVHNTSWRRIPYRGAHDQTNDSLPIHIRRCHSTSSVSLAVFEIIKQKLRYVYWTCTFNTQWLLRKHAKYFILDNN